MYSDITEVATATLVANRSIGVRCDPSGGREERDNNRAEVSLAFSFDSSSSGTVKNQRSLRFNNLIKSIF